MKTESIIFDLDGTLWDSAESVAASWTKTISESGIPEAEGMVITEADIKGVMGMTMDVIGEKFFPFLDKPCRERLMDDCGNNENEYLLAHGGRLFENTAETLEMLSRTHRLFIVSNCQKGYIEAFCNSCNTGKYFSGHLCWGDTLTPKGETIKALMRQYNVTSAVYVGDTAGDCKAAHDADLPFIHAAYGFGEIKPPLKAEAVINSIEELVKTIIIF